MKAKISRQRDGDCHFCSLAHVYLFWSSGMQIDQGTLDDDDYKDGAEDCDSA